MWSSLPHIRRMTKLAYTFGRNGAAMSLTRAGLPVWFCKGFSLISRSGLPAREGARLQLAFAEMGPTFIKLGQALSTRSDLIGEELAEDLALLQDRIPPFPTHRAKALIELELGAPLELLFSDFSETPVAAASIAQVHFATTVEGRPVAVKVLRPDIHLAFKQDIDLFYWLAGHVENYLPAARRLKPLAVIKTFEESIQKELDLRLEAAAAQTIKENTALDEGFYVPEVDWQRTSQSVLTMERITGIPVSDVAAIDAAGLDRNRLVRQAASTLFKQVFRDGFFHADLHPGNLFVGHDGNLIAVDFGITGRINHRDQLFVAEILRSFLKGDYRRVAEVHIMAGYVPAHKNVDDFALACMAIGRPIIGKPLEEISVGQLLGQLFKVSAMFEMETQPQLLLLQKNMVLAEGVGRMLNPHINMWQLAEPLIEEWAQERLSLEGRARFFAEEAKEHAKQLPRFFKKLEQGMDCFDEQGIRLHPETIAEFTRQKEAWNRRWWGISVVAVLLLALLVFNA
ncbi:MAG: 2-polyprenylphenol 6-hydroxylase [Alphaproteobacteria bacterium]|nr:2-polyprenylphenol 6-hydroxylase [Alphaproteobacteria bacterium]